VTEPGEFRPPGCPSMADDARRGLSGLNLRPYQWALAATDFVALAVVVLAASLLWSLAVADVFDSALACLLLTLLWMTHLGLAGSYDVRRVGRGISEYRRVLNGSLWTAALVLGLAFFVRQTVSRGFVLITFTLGPLVLIGGRWVWRRWLIRQRARGAYQRKVLVIGEPDRLADVWRMLESDGAREYRVIGSEAVPADPDRLLGWLDDQIARLSDRGVDTVAVATAGDRPELVQAVAWRLEGPGTGLLVSPAFGRLVGSRISVQAAAGVPFLSLDEPRLLGPQRVVKRGIDVCGSLALIVGLSPVMLLAVIGVRLSGPGPVVYAQQRIGRDGRPFTFPKFRTMVVGADRMRADVIGRPDSGIADRYRQDPRITPVGRFLRRWSLDELPQLFCVLSGSMSLVGPRPMLPEEFELLVGVHHRRHLAKPGLTGLWQVNGRKETSWDERMELDLEYIDAWSPFLDLIIIMRTAGAILSARGAY